MLVIYVDDKSDLANENLIRCLIKFCIDQPRCDLKASFDRPLVSLIFAKEIESQLQNEDTYNLIILQIRLKVQGKIFERYP